MKKRLFSYKRIRFLLWNLVFSFLLIACREAKPGKDEISIQWKGEKAEAVVIPLGLIPNATPGSIAERLKVKLVNNPISIIQDEVKIDKGAVLFKPLIAFTAGLKYEVFYGDKPIGAFEIPPLNTENLTEVVAVYPGADTLPENALKLYIAFSKPMQEGLALHNIRFIKNNKDTLHSIFLDLDQELWNRERTTLTLWFDPGRIKRDLQPHKSLGSPLQQNNSYKILIDKNWTDERGLALKSGYEKNFDVGERDSTSPDPANWVLNQPRASTREVLSIQLHESLDYLLLKNAVSVIDINGNIINGSFEPASEETILNFIPTEAWKPGEYSLKIEARLEDLAGNNLNRLFDNDLTQPNKKEQQTIFIRKFRLD